MTRTVLNEDVETLFNQKVIVEDNETKGERQDIVAGSNLEEVADRSLGRQTELATVRCGPAVGAPRDGAEPTGQQINPACARWQLRAKSGSKTASSGGAPQDGEIGGVRG